MLLILAMAMTIRILWAPQSLWYDEIASLKFSEQPYARLWSDWMRQETNPPLYYTALATWRAVFGSADAALRALSGTIGLIGIVAAWMLSRYLACPATGRSQQTKAGLWAALFVAMAPAHVAFSEEVRGYILTYAAALSALLGFAIVMRNADLPTRRQLGLLLYGVAVTIALYAHTTMAILPLIVNAYAIAWFVIQRRRPVRLAVEWLAINLLVLLAWAWWLQITVWQIGHASNVGWMASPSPLMAARWVFDTYIPDSTGAVRLVVGLIMIGLAARATWVHRHGPVMLLAVTTTAAPVLLFILSAVTPVMLPRTIFWASGPFTILVALGVASLPSRISVSLGAGLGIALFAGSYLDSRKPPAEPWHQMVDAITRADPDAWVVGGDLGVVFALQHYCPLSSCRLTLFSITPETETWTAGMPRPRPHPLGYYGSLARRHRLFSATRYGRGDLGEVAGTFATSYDMRRALHLPPVLALTAWSPHPSIGTRPRPMSRRIAIARTTASGF